MRVVLVLSIAVATAMVGGTAHGQADGARRDRSKPPVKPLAPKMTKAPQLLQAVAPIYPRAALDAKLTATVPVRIHVDENGLVTKVETPTPAGHGFDQAAIDAAMQYVFDPAEFDGKPGAIVVETDIHFVLDEQEVEPSPVPTRPRERDAKDDPAARGPPSHGGDVRTPISIEGEAIERGSRRRLTGIIVSIAELGLDAITDEKGRFFFHQIPPGNYTLLAVDDRYARFKRTITLAKSERIEVRLWLRTRGGNPYETVVEGERDTLEVTKRTLERRQMTTVPGTFGDPIRVIQTLPGLARTPFGTGFLLIRGSNPDDSGVFIDGHRVPLLFHFLGGPSVLNGEFLDSINLYPGGFPARFGRAHGGIVALETRSAKSDGVHGSVDIDLLDSGGYVRIPVGKHGALAVAGRRSYLDLMLGLFLPDPDPGNSLVVVPIYYDGQVRYDHDLGSEGKLSVTVIGSGDKLDVLSSDAEDDQSTDLGASIGFYRVIGSYRRPISRTLALTLSPAFGRDQFTFGGSRINAGGAFTSIDATSTLFSYRMRVNGRLSNRLVLDAGLDMESRNTVYKLRVPLDDDIRRPSTGTIDIDPSDLRIDVDTFAWGLHADVAYNPIEALRIVPGIRVDAYLLNASTRASVDPRITARYTISKTWLAKGYAGVFHQPPQPESLDRRFGNPDIGIERGLHFGVGAEWNPVSRWTVDGEVYFIDRSNQVAFTDRTRVDEQTGETTNINFLNSRVGDTVGLELLIKRKVTRHIFGWLSYTLSKTRTKRRAKDDYIPTLFDQRHTLNAVASYRTDGGWEYGARYRLATGTPDTPVVGSTFDADDNSYDPLEGATGSIREKTFSQLDVRVEKTWVFKLWSLGLYLDVQNLLNTENVEATEYDYRFREKAPITSVPLLPTLGVKAQW